MKIFNLLVLLSIGLFIVGCGGKTTITKVPETVVKIETVKEYVVEKCDVPADLCEFTGEGFVPTEKLLDCVIVQKHFLEVCSGKLDSEEIKD